MKVIKDPKFPFELEFYLRSESSSVKAEASLFFSSMSWISLRLPPARKAWKSFTSTLDKLRKIHRSKTMKKPRKHPNTTTAQATSTRASKFLATRRFAHKRLNTVRSATYGFNKKPASVYIDKLFKEPSRDLVEHLKPQIAHNPRSLKTAKIPHHHQQPAEEVPGTSKGGGSDKHCTSDDMWESLALASPLLHGINERAEEFIARFREEMAAQEMLARNL